MGIVIIGRSTGMRGMTWLCTHMNILIANAQGDLSVYCTCRLLPARWRLQRLWKQDQTFGLLPSLYTTSQTA